MNSPIDKSGFKDFAKEKVFEPKLEDVQGFIATECDGIKALLLEKNKNYGNSALDPVRIFSKASPVEQILVRIDDKLSRISRGKLEDSEDTVQDLIGYLVLLRVAQRFDGAKAAMNKAIKSIQKLREAASNPVAAAQVAQHVKDAHFNGSYLNVTNQKYAGRFSISVVEEDRGWVASTNHFPPGKFVSAYQPSADEAVEQLLSYLESQGAIRKSRDGEYYDIRNFGTSVGFPIAPAGA